ncbi:hypothetical protein DYB26_012843 [Aphanomyces astaci]|nr:hypothetical protein DYB26_012843 [Aphanomyces astaci]
MSVFSSIKDNISHRLETRKNDKNGKEQRNPSTRVDAWWVSSMPQIQQMKASLQIMEAMEQTHRENPALINGKVKRIVSEKVGQSLEEINNTLRSYEQLNSLRLWLRKRVERGLPLPDSLDNTTEMIREDPTGFPTKNLRY